MHSNRNLSAVSRRQLWTGRVLSGAMILFLAVDALGKFVRPEPVVNGTLELGYAESVIVPLGIVLLASTLLYALPRTAILGAILLTGYLGGAVATHVRVGNPLVSHILFPVFVGVFVWAGLVLRDARLRSLFAARECERA